MTVRQDHSKQAEWRSMRLDYVGQIGDLMQGGTGSKKDGNDPCSSASRKATGSNC